MRKVIVMITCHRGKSDASITGCARRRHSGARRLREVGSVRAQRLRKKKGITKAVKGKRHTLGVFKRNKAVTK